MNNFFVPFRVRPKLRGSASQKRPPYATSARVAFDVFDLGVMDQVRQKLTSMESSLDVLRSGGFVDTSCGTDPESSIRHTVDQQQKSSACPSPSKKSSPSKGGSAGDQVYVFKSRVTAKRTDCKTGQVSLLVSWIPDGM